MFGKLASLAVAGALIAVPAHSQTVKVIMHAEPTNASWCAKSDGVKGFDLTIEPTKITVRQKWEISQLSMGSFACGATFKRVSFIRTTHVVSANIMGSGNMIRKIALALTLMISPVYAQDLPGPAKGGWYVVMKRFMQPNMGIFTCIAHVLPADQTVKMIEYLEGPLSGNGYIHSYGPYRDQYSAESKLQSAGWLNDTQWGYWAAQSCDF